MTLHTTHFIPMLIMLLMVLLTLHRTSFLMCLLTLESMLLLVILLTSYTISHAYQPNTFFILSILTVGACEACLGLAILISMSRSFGNDQITSLVTSKC